MTKADDSNAGVVREIWSLLEQVNDPEVPVLSVVDLGIIRDVRANEVGVEIVLTPTYSGCPAMDVIRMTIRMVLLEAGYIDVKLTTVLAPAWTTDWMSEQGKEKLKAYGIAPPLTSQHAGGDLGVFRREPVLFGRAEAIGCPHCHSCHTIRISEFGSTACKALYRCEDCKEPFDYFKCH
jgi:ring-1,2-phenylacetyl-CoA epoxidase subunit PaaD